MSILIVSLDSILNVEEINNFKGTRTINVDFNEKT